MKKVFLFLSVLLTIYFIGEDLLYVTTPYKKPSISSLLKDKKIKDSLSYEYSTATINSIFEMYGDKSSPNKVVLNVCYVNDYQSCKVVNLIDIPYLLFVGTLKKEGEVIDIIYNKEIDCFDKENAVYLPSNKDVREIKYIKLVKIGVVSLFIILIIWDTFFKQQIKIKNSTITYYE